MCYLMNELAQARIADIHRQAESRRLVALARAARRRNSVSWPRAMHSRLGSLVSRRNAAEPAPASPGSYPAATT